MRRIWEYYRSRRSPDVWTVIRFNGFQWIDESDHTTREDAAARAAALNNGSFPDPEPGLT
jgi:hypothetical protein